MSLVLDQHALCRLQEDELRAQARAAMLSFVTRPGQQRPPSRMQGVRTSLSASPPRQQRPLTPDGAGQAQSHARGNGPIHQSPRKLRPVSAVSAASAASSVDYAQRRHSGLEQQQPPKSAGSEAETGNEEPRAGFWDRGLGALGKSLSDAAYADGSRSLYRGDDGLLYLA
jgi:hypothetical protein